VELGNVNAYRKLTREDELKPVVAPKRWSRWFMRFVPRVSQAVRITWWRRSICITVESKVDSLSQTGRDAPD